MVWPILISSSPTPGPYCFCAAAGVASASASSAGAHRTWSFRIRFLPVSRPGKFRCVSFLLLDTAMVLRDARGVNGAMAGRFAEDRAAVLHYVHRQDAAAGRG